MQIRAQRDRDQRAVDALVTEAFADEGPQVVSLLGALHRSGALRASLVAVDDEDDDTAGVLGHVALSRGWVDARERLVEVLVLSPLSVTPARQRAGLGTALLAAAREEAVRQGAPAVFLEGDWRYYGDRGYDPGSAHGFERPSARVPGRAFQVTLLPAHEPWMTGRLIYPEAFWSTDTVGLRDPLLAELERATD
ncbi:GNAT family N-acetyltransferase [Nocardioides aequoreus]|uniref:GNAT family N-acetyltransferase n=1 Tax=Nocardioides aequoreus TaxID=397278 RepID=UPI0004C3D0B5|nr:N-acetyltransferase [Nocardioides aequoreus]